MGVGLVLVLQPFSKNFFFGYFLTFFCHKMTLIFTFQIVKMFNAFWCQKPMTFINSYIPHSNIYWFTAENRIKSNLQDLGIFRHQIYMVAMVTQSSALCQLNNKSPTIYNYNLLNDILFGFSFPKKILGLFSPYLFW